MVRLQCWNIYLMTNTNSLLTKLGTKICLMVVVVKPEKCSRCLILTSKRSNQYMIVLISFINIHMIRGYIHPWCVI